MNKLQTLNFKLQQREFPYVLTVLAVAFLYFLTGSLSLTVMTNAAHNIVTPVFFVAEGIALAAVILLGSRVWLGIFLGQLILALNNDISFFPAFLIAAINAFEAVLGGFLFKRFELNSSMRRIKDFSTLVFLVSFVLQPFSASLGNLVLLATGTISDSHVFIQSWINWWLGNSMGQFLITPLLLMIFSNQYTFKKPDLTLLIPITLIIFVAYFTFEVVQVTFPLAFAIFVPSLMWVAYRGNLVFICLISSLVTVLAIHGTCNGVGIFTRDGNAHILELNVFIICFTLTAQFISVLIAEMLDAEAQLEQQTNRYFEQHFAIDKAAIFAETDVFGTITHVNQHFCVLSGYSEEELVGATHSLLKSSQHPREFYSDLWGTIQRGEVWRNDICNRHKNGSLYWVNTVIVPIVNFHTQKIEKYITIRFDITNRKKAEQETLFLQQKLFNAQRLETVGIFTNGIAHEFNNILAGVLGYNELALWEVEDCEDGKFKDQMNAYLDGIRISGGNAVALVKKMLIYCREEKMTVSEPIDISPIIMDAVQIFEVSFDNKMQLDVVIENDVPSILIDAAQLHQIVTNLMVNARDAIISAENSRRGYISVNLSFSDDSLSGHYCDACLEKLNDEKYLDLSISDNGTGIEQDQISRIFDPFFTTKEVGKGTGLGLSVVSGIVHNAGGHIYVSSKLGQGSGFHLLFPIPNEQKTTQSK